MQIAGLDSFDLLAPPILTLIGTVLGYLWCRTVRRGQPLSPIQRNMLFYFAVFVLGMGYAIMLQDRLAILFHWESAWIAVMMAWGVLLAVIAWARHRSNIR